MGNDKEKINEYLNKTKYFVLATTDTKNVPVLRSIGHFAAEGLITYFSTGKDSAKTTQINNNPWVSAFFQHEDQPLPTFVNVAVTGRATLISSEEELRKAIGIIGERNADFREQAEKGQLENNAFYRIDPKEVKVLDFSKGFEPEILQLEEKKQKRCCKR
jgi:pyridoxamine 5'-phosphate oxidase